jgi:arylsulfatase A-like enzyme
MKTLFSSILLLIFACLLVSFILKNQEPRKPNVLIILSDDQGWGDLGIHGNPSVETPTLDKLARESAQFDRFYVSPLCAPTRASLLTGRYHLRTGTVSVSKGMEVMNDNETTLAEMFKANGYQTGAFGKWHNGQHFPNHPNGQGFDTFFGFCGGHWSNFFDTDLELNGEKAATNGYISDVLTDKALDFLNKNSQKPFFCYVPYNAPHSPHQVPDNYFNKYKSKGLDDELASIYGMCENMDANIGRLLKRLDELKIADNTIVIFMTDNGPNGNRFNGNMKGIKGQVDEGGIRVPCFIRWRNKVTPSVTKALGAHIDIFPTLRDLCGLKSVPTLPLDGISLAKHIMGDTQRIERTIFTHTAQPEKILKPYPASVRTPQYRLTIKDKAIELYDMLNDPFQKTDIAKTKPDITEKLYKDYQKWFSEVAPKTIPTYFIPIIPQKKRIEIPTYEATFSGNITYKEGHGWVHDWLVNWSNPKDSIVWQVQSSKAQNYEVSITYTCPADKVGSMIKVAIGDKSITHTLNLAYNPVIIPSPDRVVRKEVYEKTWAQQVVGTLKIPKGNSQIVVTAPNVKAGVVGEIKSIVLKKML